MCSETLHCSCHYFIEHLEQVTFFAYKGDVLDLKTREFVDYVNIKKLYRLYLNLKHLFNFLAVYIDFIATFQF